MIQIDTTALREAQRHLQEVKKKTKVAMYRALNRVAQNAKTNASKEIREQYVIKAGDLGSTFSIKKLIKGACLLLYVPVAGEQGWINTNFHPGERLVSVQKC